ncbi:MAG: ABC transporter ATP-binding protein, partial [Bacilli bacterium]|nr:ABC transporter ATP-binding protein [Bacilli bacterium]
MPKTNGKSPARMKRLSVKEATHIFARLLKLMFQGYPWQMVLSAVLIILSAGAGALANLFIGTVVVGHYLPLKLTGASEVTSVALRNLLGGWENFPIAILVMAGIFLLGTLFTYLYQLFVAIIGQGTQKTIRDRVFSQMETLPLSYFDSRSHGDIMSIYTNDIDTLREMTSRVLPTLVNSLASMIVAFVAMILSSWLLLLVVLGFAVVIFLVVIYVTKNSAHFFIGQQRALGAVNGYIEEMISGQKVIKVFNHEEKAKEGFDHLNDQLCMLTTKAQKYSNIVGPIVNNLSNLLYVVLALVGGVGIANGWPTLGVGVLVSFLGLGRSFTSPIMQIANQANMLNMCLAGAQRIFELSDEPSETDNGYVCLVHAKKGEDGNPVETDELTNLWAWKHPHTDGSGTTYTWLKGKVTMHEVDFGYVP